jgi:chromosome partitioning protein
MCKIITVGNMKGGVAKTVTCQHLAYALAEQGKRVLSVDFDPQINLTATLSTNEENHPELVLPI